MASLKQKSKEVVNITTELKENLVMRNRLDERNIKLLAKSLEDNLFRKWLGYDTAPFQDYLNDIGITLGSTQIKRQITIYNNYHKRGIDTSEFKVRNDNVLCKVSNRPIEEQDELWIPALKELTITEFKKLWDKEVLGIDQLTCEHKDEELHICKICKVKLYEKK